MSRRSAPHYRYSGLARPFEWGYATNRIVLLLLPVAVIAGTAQGLLIGLEPVQSAVSGLWLAGVAATSWALTRELAPDAEGVAFLGLAAGVGAAFGLGTQSLIVPVALILTVRIVNRSTGQATGAVDTVLATLGLVWLGWYVTWALGVAGAAALALDGLLRAPPGQPRRGRNLAAAATVAVATAPVWVGGILGARLPERALLLAAVAAAGLVAALRHRPPTSPGDVDGQPLEPMRVRAATLVGIAALALAGLDPGLPVRSVAACWACVAAGAIGVLGSRGRPSG